MRKTLIFMASTLALTGPVLAGSVAGFGGGTEITQIANNIQLVIQYEQQVMGYVRQGLQLQNELTNLTKNPASLLGADIGGLINGVGTIMSGGQAIGGGLAKIDANFAKTFKSPTADTLAKSFTKWNATSTDTLEGALKAAGMHRDQFQSDTDALTALYNESQATGGNLQALQTLAKINTAQVQQMQKLGDLLATQNIASSTYMAAQTAKSEAQNQETDAVKRSLLAPNGPESNADTKAAPAKKWNLY